MTVQSLRIELLNEQSSTCESLKLQLLKEEPVIERLAPLQLRRVQSKILAPVGRFWLMSVWFLKVLVWDRAFRAWERSGEDVEE